MTEHDHKHHSGHDHEHEHGSHNDKSAIHKDWRTWTIVGLMLIAMLTYIFSMDESIEPGEVEQQQVPAVE